MSSVPVPQIPQYRVTLFFGPEPLNRQPTGVSCVFNVKKRSWKAGVQVAVEMEEEQLARTRQVIGFEDWLKEELRVVPLAERDQYDSRARDLFVQGVCALKLALALEAGLRQENRNLTVETLVNELDHALPRQADRLKSQILAELDLGER
ncbi:hypothetical protein MYX04_05215 [Nitrospiraceae bacterium AH_259_D15_M11_P09]|nr:hypothetical protein [Nitrospiraceae bacterium AH_259_D15_M11_P09]